MSKEPKQSYFLDYQLKWLRDNSPVKIWEKSRRIGATYVQSYEDVTDVMKGDIDKVWFSSADESAAKEYIKECEKWVELFDVVAKNIGEITLDKKNDVKALVIEFSNGGRIHALSSNPKAFRSKGGKIILDEFAFHEQAALLWKAAKPSATWGYPIRILSTHNGRGTQFNQFIEKIDQGKLKWSKHRTPITTAVEDGLFDKISGRTTTAEEREEWLQSLREDCFDDDTFNEEYMAIPSEGSSRFLSYELISQNEEDCLWDEINPALWKPIGNLYVGYDVARKKDFAVITVIEQIGEVKYLRAKYELQNVKFHIQRDILWSVVEHPAVRRCCIDQTGLGMQIAEETEDKFGSYKVEKVTFTNASKSEMAFKMRSSFEAKTLKVFSDSIWREDLNSVKKIVTASSIRLAADKTDDGHADRFWSLALANHAASDYAGPVWAHSGKIKRTSTIAGQYN